MRYGYPDKWVVNTQDGINILLKTVTLSDKTTYNIWSTKNPHNLSIIISARQTQYKLAIREIDNSNIANIPWSKIDMKPSWEQNRMVT